MTTPLFPAPSPKHQARQCDELAEKRGYRVVNLEQRRASRTHVGLPDRRYQGQRASFFFELKFDTDRLTREQYTFLLAELESGCYASCGGYPELQALINALAPRSGVLARDLCYRQLENYRVRGFRGERKSERKRRAA